MTAIATLFVGKAAAAGALQTGAALSTTAAGAATSGLIGSGGALTLSGLASGVSFASGALKLFGAGDQSNAITENALRESRVLEAQSRDDLLEARQEELRGKQEANDILERLNSTLAQQRVAFASKGLDVGFGTPVNVADETNRRGDIQLSTARTDAQIRALSRRRQAQERLVSAGNRRLSAASSASSARQSGLFGGLQTFGTLIDRRLQRG